MAPFGGFVTRVWLETLRISLPTIVEAARGKVSTEVCTQRLDAWSRRVLKLAGLHLEVVGREHINAGTRYIVMSNHQSSCDIPVLFQALQVPLRMVAKREIFQMPFIGSAMRAAGFVEVDHGNRRSAIRTLATAHKRLDKSMSLWIAPEGTRSRTGQLGAFERGGFYVAMSSGIPILPVTIDGTRNTFPAGRLTVHRGLTTRVTISAPIDPVGYGLKGIDRLTADTRGIIENHLPAPSSLADLEVKSPENARGQRNRDLAMHVQGKNQER